jgi:hypothetical protein
MKRYWRAGLVALLVLAPASRAAAQSIPNATAKATIDADPKDVSTADAIIAALYDANTNLVDQKRGAERFRSLFVPGARLMPTARPANGAGVIGIQTVDDYVQRASSGPPRHGFSEREIARRSEAFGNIMQVFSTYESRRDSADPHPGRGINSIQLFNDGSRWWVVGVLWDNARPDKPIPAEYLKSGGAPPRE